MNSICQGIETTCLALACGLIYDFQTLITGVLAICAAWYAATPVWRQLKDSNLQTTIMYRETLAQRLREAEERTARIAQAIDGPLKEAARLTNEPWGEPIKIDEHTAVELYQNIGNQLDWYLVTLIATEDRRIEDAKKQLKKALDDLIETLFAIYFPAQYDQDDEGYSFSDVEWRDILSRSEESRSLASVKVSAVQQAYEALRKAQILYLQELREKIGQLDRRIARES